MILQAKFAGWCRICQKPIKEGAQIWWHRGGRAEHLLCSNQIDRDLAAQKIAVLSKQDAQAKRYAVRQNKHVTTISVGPKGRRKGFRVYSASP